MCVMLARATRRWLGPLRVLQAERRQVEAEDVGTLRQERQVRAGAAAAVERPRRGDAGEGRVDQRRDELTKTLEPEVLALGDEGLLE